MLREFFSREGVEYTPENIRKICNLHTLKTQEELFAAIGFKTIILGENDKNELKDKPTSSNWKKYISFAFGGSKTNKEKPTEEKEPLQKIDSKKILKLTPEAIQKNYVIAECCKPIPGDDVLGYIGDLKEFAAAVSGIKLIFTTELYDGTEAYKVMPNGRYKHRQDYVENLLRDNGYTKISCKKMVLRKEDGKDVNGILWKAENV